MAQSELPGRHVIINMDDSVIPTIDKPNYHSYQAGIRKNKNIDAPLICKIESASIEDEYKKDYEPNILSIGPYHNGKPATKVTQRIKYEYLDYILKMNPNKKLEDYMKAIKGIENQIRSCYRDEIKMNRNSFLKMMLLDGCFILLTLHGAKEISSPMPNMPNNGIRTRTNENMKEFIIDMEALEFNKNHQNIQTKKEDAVIEDDYYDNSNGDFGLCSRDLLLLENQIPFFVIAKIYEIMSGNNKTSLLIESIAKSLEGMIRSYPKPLTLAAFGELPEFHHLLHLCHMCFKPSKIQSCKYPCQHQSLRWHRAIYYNQVGISFKKKEFFSDTPHSFLDIIFCNGMMEIPSLTIDDSTRCLFRNLIAFERKYPQIGNHVTAYVVFWSQFIIMPDDVTILTKKGIIVNLLNSDAEVCDIFRELTEGTVFNFPGGCYLNSTNSEMEVYYQSNKSRLMKWLGSMTSIVRRFIPQNSLIHV